jgi:hypothetical protein
METNNAPAAGESGAVTAPAPLSQDEACRLVLAVEPHLDEGTALLRRCLDLKTLTPGDTGLIGIAARLIAADAALGARQAKLLATPRRKAKSKRPQTVKAGIAELNSIFAQSRTRQGR